MLLGEVLHGRTGAHVGWTIANRAFETRPGAEEIRRKLEYVWEDLYLEAARHDDYVGVQAYSAQWVGLDGIEPHPVRPDNTLVRTAYRPDALGIAIRHTADVLPNETASKHGKRVQALVGRRTTCWCCRMLTSTSSSPTRLSTQGTARRGSGAWQSRSVAPTIVSPTVGIEVAQIA